MNDASLLQDQPIAWRPTPEVIEKSRLTAFMKQVGASTWEDLYAYSINDVEAFTEEVLRFLNITFDPPYENLLNTSNGIEFPTWLAAKSEPEVVAAGLRHAGLNITTMCLDRWQSDEHRSRPAVIWEGESGSVVTLSYADLFARVGECAAKLCDLDIREGDAVGIHLPMLPETVVALLAINRIGAIAVPVFSGYGIDAITSRMEAVAAKALFTCHGTQRRGKAIDMLTVAARAVANVDSIKSVIIVDDPDAGGRDDHIEAREARQDEARRYEYLRNDLFGGRRIALWSIHREPISSCEISGPAATDAEDPLIILYTSGTTGKPKGIAHTHASFPIKAAQDMAFGTDVGPGTRICWYTDIGWMMGPWLIYGALINGATICIYDGAPDYPTPDRMWEFCAKHRVEILGISPTLVRSLAAHEESASSPHVSKSSPEPHSTEKEREELTQRRKDAKEDAKTKPFERHDLSSLRAFASTGEPWNPAPWWWLFEKVGDSKLPIINYSGGTEISGGILMGNPLLPIKPCSFPAPCPGMDVDILDEDGNSVEAGKVGELVIKQPWIGMARGFWQEKERYLEIYWRRFKNVWVHGDWAMRDKDGHWFILGRSDDTLKVAGKRVGPAEVESILVSHPLVTEAAVIGVPDEMKGTAMVAFVVTSDKEQVTSEDRSPDSSLIPRPSSLEQELKTLVAKDMGKPLAPSKIHFVSALPKTRNAKVMRRVIRAAYLGEDPGDLSALEDPNVVEIIRSANSSD